jgi:hypothetical protein
VILRRLSDGLIQIRFIERGTSDVALWSRMKVRKAHPCLRTDLCGRTIIAGEVAFAPIGNQSYRAARLCVRCAGPTTE